MLVGIGDAQIMLFAELILRRIGIRIAAQPELLDELLALFFVGHVLEGLGFFVRDDPFHVLVQPLLIFGRKLVMERVPASPLG